MKKKLLYLLTLAMLLTACSAPQPTPSESTSDDPVVSESTTESVSESESIEESESLSESEQPSESESEQPSETESEVPVESESEEPSESEQPSESESEDVVVSTTVSKSSFDSTSGDLDSVISYKCYKGGGTSDPAIYDNIIRLYQGSHGGYIVLTAKDGYTITSATVGSAMSTTVGYTIGNQSSPTNGGSLSANDKFTLNNLDCGQVGFYCLGTSKSARLYVNYLSVTYLGKAPGGNGGNGGNTSESEPPVTSESEPPVTSESEPPVSSESESEYTGPGWGGKQTPDYPSTYYDSCKGKSGTNLKNQLASFNKPRSKSYDWSRYEAADEAEGAPNYILCLYTRHNIPKNNHVGSYSWDTWNREHIWTQKAYPNSDTDNHNIFACEGQINNVRGNLKFGDVENSSSNRVSVHGHQTDCYKASSLFEPCDAAKGEVARSVMYGAVYYGYSLSNMIDIKLALQWNEEFPVSNREIYRNNTVNDLQGNRNPFVDHPEYASLIWG